MMTSIGSIKNVASSLLLSVWKQERPYTIFGQVALYEASRLHSPPPTNLLMTDESQ